MSEILAEQGDGIKGDRIVCFFRKITKPILISGTHRHNARMCKIEGIPAETYIEKPFRYKR